MATLRSDIIIPEIFTPYLVEETTKRDAFLASGVVQPMAELNASEDGGDFINVPFYAANLSSTFERLTDSTSLTPGKITADKQRAAVVHRGNAFESRDLAAMAAGSDPMAAIGQKLASYIAHERQKICCPAAPVFLALLVTPVGLLSLLWPLTARLATRQLNLVPAKSLKQNHSWATKAKSFPRLWFTRLFTIR